MTTKETDTAAELDRLNENIGKIEELSQRLVSAMSQKKQHHPGLEGPSQELYVKAAAAYMAEMMAHPSKILEHQIGYWGKALKHYVEAQQQIAQGKLAPPEDHTGSDRRFKNELWETHPFFNYLKQQYLMSSEAITNAVEDLEGLEAKDRERVRYFTRQIVDLMSPTNFLGTNPEALSKAVETEGQSLVDGLENLVRDIEANDGDLMVTLADKDAFLVGENIAASEGSVVYRNDLFELIQYAPSTETVYKTPLIIFPPWINKFYVLDLKPQNSLIKWIVDQGYTLFVVSWKNPDASYRNYGLDDYVEKGYLTAVEEVKKITGEDQVNAVGYCIAGSTLAMTLSLLEKQGDKSIKSATLFTTLTDFSDQGEFTAFLSDDFVDAIEAEVNEEGILDRFIMSRTFSYLRSNDLVYQPAIRSYMMGESPPAFDLLFWNGDGTNLPACMAVDYLRGLCQQNKFADGGFDLLGDKAEIKNVKVPVCAIACETDHIAAWTASFAGVKQMGSRSKTFILSESGHIAGIVNPPSKKKYGHYTNDDWSSDAETWLKEAEFHEGSWWPRWDAWLKKRSGRQVKARIPGSNKSHPALAPAPGAYVVEIPQKH